MVVQGVGANVTWNLIKGARFSVWANTMATWSLQIFPFLSKIILSECGVHMLNMRCAEIVYSCWLHQANRQHELLSLIQCFNRFAFLPMRSSNFEIILQLTIPSISSLKYNNKYDLKTISMNLQIGKTFVEFIKSRWILLTSS